MSKKRTTHQTTRQDPRKHLHVTGERKALPTGHTPKRVTIVMRDKRARRAKDRLRKQLRDW